MAISLAALVGLGGAAFGQSPSVVPPAPLSQPPKTQWTPFNQTPAVPAAPPVAAPTVLAPPAAVVLPVLAPPTVVPPTVVPPTVAPPSAQPGLVPKTLTFQKDAGTSAPSTLSVPPLTFQKGAGETVPMIPPTPDVPSLPPLGVPAIPVKMVRDPQTEKEKADEKQDKKDKEDEEAGKKKDVPKASDRQAELTKGTLPNRQNVFRLTSDADLNSRIQQELGNRKDPFPKPASLSTEPLVYQPKTLTYPPMRRDREPAYVVHRRLYFEEKNSERAGWEMGFLQPFVSASYFYKDLFFLPHNVASGFWKNRWDTSAGKCLPGTPTPYYLYPQGFTVSGLMFQATLLTGLPFIFPG